MSIVNNSQLVPKRDVPGIEKLLASDGSSKLLESAQPFMELLMHNECALREIETKLNVLNDEFSLQYNYNPIESIKNTRKRPYEHSRENEAQGHSAQHSEHRKHP